VLSLPTIGYFGSVAFTPAGEGLVAADEDGRLTFWSLANGTASRKVGPEVREHWFALSPDGGSIALGAGGPTSVWDTTTGRPTFVAPIRDADFDWSPQGTALVVRDAILDPTGRLTGRIEIEGFEVREPRFAPDGRRVALTGDRLAGPEDEDGVPVVVVWDLGEQRVVSTIDAASFDAEFDPSGSRLATDGQGHDAPALWDVSSGAPVLELAGTGAVLDVAFSPDGSRIATAGVDGVVRLFDAWDGRELFALPAGGSAVRSVAFSDDGRMLAAQRPGEVRVWALDVDLLLDIARERVTRSLSDDECRQYLHMERCPP
jgi:WD40 repeat protein